MKKLSALLALLGLLLVGDPALAQKGTPVFGLDKSGTTRALAIVDPTVGSYLPFGGIDTTSHTISLSAYGISGIGNTTGPTGDGQVNLAQNGTKTAAQIYGPAISPGYYFWDVTRSVLDLEAGTTVQNADAYGAYTYNNIASGAGPNAKNAVAYFADGINIHVGASTWGINTSCSDSYDNTALHSVASTCVGYEVDFSAANGSSTFEGLGFQMQGVTQPANANAVQVSQTAGATAKWQYGYIVDNGATLAAALQIGATAKTGTSLPSQNSYYGYFNSGGTEYYLKMFANNSAMNFISTEFNDGLYIQGSTGNVNIGAFGASTNVNIGLFPKGTGAVVANGPLTATGVLTGASGSVTGGWSMVALTATGFASIGNNNTAIPADALRLGISTNQSGGSAEADLWNQSASVVPGISFRFNQVTTGGSAFTTLFELGADTGKSSKLYTHLVLQGNAPTGLTCGAGATNVGAHDGGGRITAGTGSPTTCAFTFASTFTATAPVCFAQNETTAMTARATTISVTAVTFTFTAALVSGDKISYSCQGI